MGMAVGAALKKIAVALLTDRKVLKSIGMTLLVLAVAVIMPLFAFLALLNGTIELDVGMLQQQIMANLSTEDRAMLEDIESTMEEIRTAFKDAGMPERVGEAQAVYIMALYDHSRQPGFVSRLVSCFWPEQTDDQIVRAVNTEFGTSITTQDFTNVMRNIRSRQINTSGFGDPGSKNNLDLVEWAIAAYNADWGYVMGTYGLVLTEQLLQAKIQQLPDAVGSYEAYIRANYMGLRTADCVGLIKGYSWYNPDTGEIDYGSHGHPDVSANQFYANAVVKGPISTMPEIPGLILHAEGHVGIYIGGGYAIEAMGTRYGVVKTRVANRNWTGWCKSPYITYLEEGA